MRNQFSIMGLLAGMLIIVAPALADFSTPFIEDSKNQVGNIIEGRGFLLAEEGDRGTQYLIMVTSDTRVHSLIIAEAGQGIVRPDVLGRECIVRAEVLSAPRKSASGAYAGGMRLKVLSAIRTDAAKPADRPATAPTTRP